jgi:hypothetical protein
MSAPVKIRDETGTTLAELVIGMAMAMTVLAALTTLIISTLHTTARVSARVDAAQQARLAVTKIVDQLHSACVAPKISPVREGSTGTEIRFVHATGAAVTPTPTLTAFRLNGETLERSDYAWQSGTAPNWVFDETEPTATTTLAQHVAPVAPGAPVFTYYAYANGGLTGPLATGLDSFDALRTVQVSVAIEVGPSTGGDRGEAATPAEVQGGATFRLTPPSFKNEAPSYPCQ